jgi:hypothetical protein
MIFCVLAIVEHPWTDDVGNGFANDCADEEVALCSFDCVGRGFVAAEDEA